MMKLTLKIFQGKGEGGISDVNVKQILQSPAKHKQSSKDDAVSKNASC
jgi:hypothetical protein